MEIRALRPTDDRSAFRSGDPQLDAFFARSAAQNQFRHHVGSTYVAVEGARILGCATVAAASIEIERLPEAQRRKLPHYPLPILRLARLAVDEAARGLGLGEALLRFVLTLALEMSKTVGCVGVVVDAKEGAVAFYERYGFAPLDVLEGGSPARPTPTPLFLPLAAVAAAAKP